MTFISCIHQCSKKGSFAHVHKTHIILALGIIGLIATLFGGLGFGKIAPFNRMPNWLKISLVTSGLLAKAGALLHLSTKKNAHTLERQRIAALPVVYTPPIGNTTELEICLVYSGLTLTKNYHETGEFFHGVAALPCQNDHSQFVLRFFSGHPRATSDPEEVDTMMNEAIQTLLDKKIYVIGTASRPVGVMAPGAAFAQWQARNRGD